MKGISANVHFTVTEQRSSKVDYVELQPVRFVSNIYDKEWFIGCIVVWLDEYIFMFIKLKGNFGIF